ncbi:MAG: ABC transporter permease [Planctomycetota bacterium]
MSSLVQNTLLVSGGAALVGVPLGGLLAWLIVRTDVPGRRLAAAILAVMLFVPLYLQAAAWQAGFGLEGAVTLGMRLSLWLEGLNGAIFLHGMAAVPWAALIIGVALRSVPADWEELALLDGSAPQVFVRVTLRLVMPAIGLAALLAAMVAATEIVVTDLCIVRTYAEEVYMQFTLGDQNSAVLRLLPGVGVTAVLLLLGLLLARAAAPRHWDLAGRPPRLVALGHWRWPAAMAMLLVLLLVAGLPLGSLLWKAGVVVEQTATGRERVWSVAKFAGMIGSAPWRFRRELEWTFLIGGLAAAAAIVSAIPLAWLARRGGWRAAPALLVVAAGLSVPGPLVGIVLIRLLNGTHAPDWLAMLYSHSILAPWLALWVRAMPVAVIVLWHAMSSIPRELEDVAALDGCGPVRRLLFLALPMRYGAVAAAFLLALAVTFGEVSASILVLPPGVMTVANQVFSLMHYGVEDQVAAICLANLAIVAVLVAAVAWLMRGGQRPQAVSADPAATIME